MTPWGAAPQHQLVLDTRVYFAQPGKAESNLPLLHAVYYIHLLAEAELEFTAADGEGLELASFRRGRFNATPEVLKALGGMKVLLENERARILQEHGITQAEG